jgi:hypothetical protein
MQNPTKGVKMQNPTKGVKANTNFIVFGLNYNVKFQHGISSVKE